MIKPSNKKDSESFFDDDDDVLDSGPSQTDKEVNSDLGSHPSTTPPCAVPPVPPCLIYGSSGWTERAWGGSCSPR